ncbi:MAG: hypothetical protein AAFP19_07440 [Bacteroidota bacterium]
MGHVSIVHGYISALVDQPPKGEKLYQLNQSKIAALPAEDNYPWITKWMFSAIPPNTQLIYREQIIHFGASYKQLESEWHEWLFKFEQILRQLYWHSVTLHLETELVGNHQYNWLADINHWQEGEVQPTSIWTFEGGPRDFRDQLKR